MLVAVETGAPSRRAWAYLESPFPKMLIHWPAYRLEWQSLGSLQRRLRVCYFGVRAEMPAFGSDDLVAIELYLAARAKGLSAAVPGVRR